MDEDADNFEDSLVLPTVPSSRRVLAPSHLVFEVFTGDLTPTTLPSATPPTDTGSGTHIVFTGSAEMHAVLNATGNKIVVNFTRITPSTARVYTVVNGTVTNTQRAVVPIATLPVMSTAEVVPD